MKIAKPDTATKMRFDVPVVLSHSLNGAKTEIRTVEEATELMDRWPAPHGKWYFAARKACAAAVSGQMSPHMARTIFVQAAVEAKMAMPI